MMNLADLERHYQSLLADFQTGRIDIATFIAALDQLQFQDKWGRYWMIGSQTGAWYYYDGQSWRQADPQAEPELAASPELTQVYETRPLMRQKALLIAGIALAMILVLLVLPLGSPSAGGPLLAPSPRPPISSTPGSGGGGSGGQNETGRGGNGNATGLRGAILGTVIDLSSGQPGAGVEVSVSGAIVRTDTDGSYSITGLHAGQYAVAPHLQGQGVPVQSPIFVNLNGNNSVIVDLAYYSKAPPLPTDTPQPAVAAIITPPGSLPAAGAVISHRPLLLAGLGVVFLLAGGILFKIDRMLLARSRRR